MKKNNRKIFLILFPLLIMIPAILLLTYGEQITKKSDSFVVGLHEDIDTDVTKYLEGIRDPDEAVVNVESVDVNKIGIYDMQINYKNVDYIVHIDVRDFSENEETQESEDIPEFGTSNAGYPINIPEDAKIGGEFETKEAAYGWAEQYLNDATSEWYKAFAGSVVRKLKNGNVYIWIAKY